MIIADDDIIINTDSKTLCFPYSLSNVPGMLIVLFKLKIFGTLYKECSSFLIIIHKDYRFNMPGTLLKLYGKDRVFESVLIIMSSSAIITFGKSYTRIRSLENIIRLM